MKCLLVCVRCVIGTRDNSGECIRALLHHPLFSDLNLSSLFVLVDILLSPEGDSLNRRSSSGVSKNLNSHTPFSPIWQYCIMDSNDPNTAYCQMCQKAVRGVRVNTSNIWKHMRIYHKREYLGLKQS